MSHGDEAKSVERSGERNNIKEKNFLLKFKNQGNLSLKLRVVLRVKFCCVVTYCFKA